MARINIDDSLYTDHRFIRLVMLLKDYDRAIGSLVRAWTVAQKWFTTPEKTIPAEVWKRQDLRDEIIEVGLAERVGDQIRICGADEQFAWLTQRINAGRKGGASERRAVAKRKEAVAKHSLTPAKPLTLSLTHSLNTESKRDTVVEPAEAAIDPPSPTEPISIQPIDPKPVVKKLHWLGEVWNQKCGSLAKVEKTHLLMGNISKRVKEEPSREFWERIVEKIAVSDFCNGRSERVFYATFSWMISKGHDGNLNYAKVDGGTYDNKRQKPRNDMGLSAQREPGYYDDIEKYTIRSDEPDQEAFDV